MDALAVSLQRSLCCGRQALQLLLRHADDAQGAHELVGVQRGCTQNFRQFATHQAAVEFELPAALLRMDKAQTAPRIQSTGPFDVRHIR